MGILLAFAPFILFVAVEQTVGVLAGLITAATVAAVLLARELPLVFPMHPSPRSRMEPFGLAAGTGVHQLPPLTYMAFLNLWKDAAVILTDSGGIQEEATALGKPMLVMRDVTERPEAIASGNGLLVGAHQDAIVAQASRLLADPQALAAMSLPSDAFGDGRASERIVEALARISHQE